LTSHGDLTIAARLAVAMAKSLFLVNVIGLALVNDLITKK